MSQKIKEFKLEGVHKAFLNNQFDAINESDIQKTKTRFGSYLRTLQKDLKGSSFEFLCEFLENCQMMYEMLCDEDFEISLSTKIWITVALIYVISPIDFIPDAIPVIGYLDDAAVVLYTMKMIQDDIQRYRLFCINRSKLSSGQSILKTVQEGRSHQHIVVATGFLTDPGNPDKLMKSKWNTLKRLYPQAHIHFVEWDTKTTQELSTILQKLPLALAGGLFMGLMKIGVTTLQVKTLWDDAKNNAKLFSEPLAVALNHLQLNQPERQDITLVGHSLGARLMYHTTSLLHKNDVNHLYTCGGALSRENDWRPLLNATKHWSNCRSDNDFVLQYLYQIAEVGDSPIGLIPVGKRNSNRRTDKDCTSFINHHSHYAEMTPKWMLPA